MSGVGVEVLFRQAHFRQVFTGGTVEHDGVGRRQVVGGDVVRQHRQRAHATQRAFAGQGAFPVWRATNVGAHRAPLVQRRHLRPTVFLDGEHRDVHLAELLRLDRCTHHGIDLFITGPDILQADFLAIDHAQHILLDVEANGAGNGIGDHQWWRGEEGLLGIRVDTPVEVAVTRQHGGGIQVAVDDFLLNHRVQGTGHAVAGGAGEGDDAETELLQLFFQAGFFQIQLHGLGAWRQRRLDPRLAGQAQPVGISCNQACSNHVARVAGVGAAGDGGDDHRTIRHLPRQFFPVAGNALGGQVAGGDTGVRVGRAGHVAHHARQVEAEGALIDGSAQAVGPQTGGFGVGFHQFDLLLFTAGQAQVVDGLLVDGEHRRSGAVFRGHVGNGGAVAQGQGTCTLTMELQVSTDHFLLAQELGQGQDQVSGGDVRGQFASQLDADDFRQTHPGGAAEHHVFGFQAAYANGDHTQCIDMRRVAVGADAGVRVGDAVVTVDHR